VGHILRCHLTHLTLSVYHAGDSSK
jgi:hypothetical protein